MYAHFRPISPSHKGLRQNKDGKFGLVGGIAVVFLASTTLAILLPVDDPAVLAAGFVATLVAGSFGFARMLRLWARPDTRSIEPTPLRALRRHPELLAAYSAVTHSLCHLADQTDEILRDAAVVRLANIQEELRSLSEGKLVFTASEAWRTAYERVLRTPGMDRYHSVAWLRNEDYWRNVPGQHSMQVNYDLVQLGVRIERILILNDFFWPPAATLPAKVICQWIEAQHKRGLVIRLVRESEIEDEPDLLRDFGLYGRRAAGQLELDENCRTVRFTLDFAPETVRLFDERWRRLLLFTVSFRELLDWQASRG